MSKDRSLLKKYLQFCASPLSSEQQIKEDYEHLVSHPMVTHLTFHRPHILAVATKSIDIIFDDSEFTIGEFIIFIIRQRQGRIWSVDFRFCNTTNSLAEFKDKTLVGMVMHPHIYWEEYPDIAINTGELCISRGQFEVYQAVRKGYMYQAVDRLIKILHIYNPQSPFEKIENWSNGGDDG